MNSDPCGRGQKPVSNGHVQDGSFASHSPKDKIWGQRADQWLIKMGWVTMGAAWRSPGVTELSRYRERSGHTTACQGGLCSRRSPLTHTQSTVDSVSHLCSCQLSTKQIGSSEKATPARDIRLYEHHSASILEHSRWRFLQVHSSPGGRDRVTVNSVILLSFMCQKAEMPPL